MQQLEREEGEAWSATAWTMYGSWTDELRERIAARQELWFLAVKNRCLAEEREAIIEASKLTVEDLTEALVELGELIAEQDDALVELAGLIS